MANPLVTLLLTVYNQEAYVGDALRSALAQDYSPLEVIVADDGSSDGTVEIVKEIIRKYRGQARIVVNVNVTNLGIALNYEKAFSLAKGEYVFTFGGDDVSEPTRVSTMMRYWLSLDPRPTVMESGGWEINLAGEVVKKMGRREVTGGFMIGAFAAYSRRVFDEFPRIVPEYGRDTYEDCIYANRARMIGTEAFCDAHLLKYRVGSGVSTGGQYRRKMLRGSRAISASLRQLLIDAEGHPHPDYSSAVLCARIAVEERYQRLLDGSSVFVRAYAFCGRLHDIRGAKVILISFLLVLPRIVGDRLLAFKFKSGGHRHG